jgi:choline-sulfatase
VAEGVSGARPNVLVIMVDQLAACWLPVYGHDIVHAPNLTALAEQGLTFDAAYCPSPLCAPSRSAMLAGRLPSRLGVFDNAAELPASVPTVTHHLRAAGYHTSLIGKMHFIGPDQLHGFEERLMQDIYPAGLDWTPDWRNPLTEPLPWYHNMESVLHPGVCEASMQTDYDEEVAFRAARKLFDLARYHRGQPFLLLASFSHPHDPWEIGRRYWDLYDPRAIAPPAVEPLSLAAADPHSRRLRQMCGADEADLTEEQIRTARHAYYAAISYVDERIGQLLAALHDAGLASNTIVIFTADHGEMLGERGLWYKMAFFEPSARVPLIIRAPGAVAGQRVAEPVSLLDLAPTLLQLAGDADAGDLDGHSLLPWPRGDRHAQPTAVVAEYLAEGVTAPAVMVRRERYKLVCCEGDPDQLYDLATDPLELANLAGNPDHAQIHRCLRAEVASRWDLADLREQVLTSQRQRRLVSRALNQGAHAAWDFQPQMDGAMRYVRSRADLYELQRRARLNSPTPQYDRTSMTNELLKTQRAPPHNP